jgi:hypothetical protein
MLKDGARSKAQCMMWVKEPEYVVHTRMVLLSETEKVMYIAIPKGFEPAKFNDSLAANGVKECMFSVSLSTANIFFKANYSSFDTGGFRFKLPEKIFKVQRRKDIRLTIRDGYVVKLEFDDPLQPGVRMAKKLIDISASGCAIVVEDEEAPMFQVGVVLQNIAIKVAGRVINCDAEVRHARPFPSQSRYEGMKIGLLFSNIRPGDSQHIASYVFSESRKYYTKFL